MRYIIAKQSTCFLALLEMIISDVLDYTFFTQDMLADYFGINILRGQESDYSNITNIKLTSDYREIGVHLDEKQLDDLFINTGIPLRTYYFPANQYGIDPVNKQKQTNDNKQYLIYTYSYGSLYHLPQYYRLGHVALLETVNANGTITVYDPGPKDAGVKTFKKSDMYDAMWDRRGGIYLFCRYDM